MAFVVFIAIYLLSLLILSGLNILLDVFTPMWLMFTPFVNSVFVIYILFVFLTCILCNIVGVLNKWLNIMLNILTIKIPKIINKLLYG